MGTNQGQTQLNSIYVRSLDGTATGASVNSLSLGTKTLTTSVLIGGLGTGNKTIVVSDTGTTITGPTFVGALNATGQASLLNVSMSNLGVSGNTSMANASIGTLAVLGQTTLANTSTTNLGVTGLTTLQNASLNGTLNVAGRSTLNNVSISSLSVANNVDFVGNMNIQGTLSGLSNLSLNTLTTTGSTTLANASVNGTLVVGTNASVNGQMSVDGNTTVRALNVNGATTFNNSVGITNNTLTISGTGGLSVTGTGQTTLQNTSVQGLTANNTWLGNTVITGQTDINTTGSAITTIGNSLTTMNVSGTVNINTGGTGITRIGATGNTVTLLGTVTAPTPTTSDTSVATTAYVNGQSFAKNGANANTYSALQTMSGGISVTGATKMNDTGSGTTTIGNSLATTNVSGTVNLAAATNINTTGAAVTTIGSGTSGTLMAGNCSMSSTLAVVGNCSFNNVSMTGAVNINTGGAATTTIGNSLATTNVSGTVNLAAATNINTTGEAVTTIGSGTSGTLMAGNCSMSSTLAVVGNCSFNNVNMRGSVNIQGGNFPLIVKAPNNYGARFDPVDGQGNKGNIALGATFLSLSNDIGSRRVSDIYSGFSGNAWNTAYMSFGVVDTSNDLNNPTPEKMRITSNGNVGIGTTAPASKLDVNGNVNVTGDIVLKVSDCTPMIRPSKHSDIDHRLLIYPKLATQAGVLELSSDYGLYNIPFNKSFACREATADGNNGTYRFIILGNGNVGIGTTSPIYPLHVASTALKGKDTTQAGWWANTTGTASAPAGSDAHFSVNIGIFTSSMLLTSTLYIQSDRRIKSNIVDVEDDRALRDLRLLKPKTYAYKDVVTRGSEPVYGFIAQEVKEVLNYASSVITEVIPNVYELATFSTDTLTLTSNTSDLSRDASGALFPKLKVKTREGKDEFVNIVEVIDEHTVKVDKDLTDWGGMLDASGQLVPGNKIFVYGQEVNDFHTLNKDAIWTVATAALQEVDRQLQAEKQKVSELQTTLASVQTALASTQETISSLVARLTALEQKA